MFTLIVGAVVLILTVVYYRKICIKQFSQYYLVLKDYFNRNKLLIFTIIKGLSCLTFLSYNIVFTLYVQMGMSFPLHLLTLLGLSFIALPTGISHDNAFPVQAEMGDFSSKGNTKIDKTRDFKSNIFIELFGRKPVSSIPHGNVRASIPHGQSIFYIHQENKQQINKLNMGYEPAPL